MILSWLYEAFSKLSSTTILKPDTKIKWFKYGLNLFFPFSERGKNPQPTDKDLHPISESQLGFSGAKFHCKTAKLKSLRVYMSDMSVLTGTQTSKLLPKVWKTRKYDSFSIQDMTFYFQNFSLHFLIFFFFVKRFQKLKFLFCCVWQ